MKRTLLNIAIQTALSSPATALAIEVDDITIQVIDDSGNGNTIVLPYIDSPSDDHGPGHDDLACFVVESCLPGVGTLGG